MTNPNRTVAAWRNRKWIVAAEDSCHTLFEAEGVSERWGHEHPGDRIRISAYRTGPRTATVIRYMVRRYIVKGAK